MHVSESTVLRVLTAEGIALPGNPRRDPIPRAPWPDWLEWKPNHIWAYDFTHFTRARRAAIAILDMVSRKWLTTLVAAEESSTQVEVAFTAALDAEGMSEAAESWASPELQEALNARDDDRLAELTVAGQVPLLLAVSDNGPQMRSYSTREFMAALAIAQQSGRPSTPTDQAWIETLFGHVKGEWPHLEKIRDPGELELELDRVRAEYNAVRLHASIGYVTPDDEHEAAARRSAKPAATDWNRPAKTASTTVEHNDRPCHENKITGGWVFPPDLSHELRYTSGDDPLACSHRLRRPSGPPDVSQIIRSE